MKLQMIELKTRKHPRTPIDRGQFHSKLQLLMQLLKVFFWDFFLSKTKYSLTMIWLEQLIPHQEY